MWRERRDLNKMLFYFTEKDQKTKQIVVLKDKELKELDDLEKEERIESIYFGIKYTTDTKLLIYDKAKEEKRVGKWIRFELS